MNRNELNKMGKLYESVVFVARQQDLTSEPIDQQRDCGDQGDVEIALDDLKKLHEYSKKLHELIRSKSDVDGWMQAKITKAADYVSEVFHRLDSVESKGEMCCDEV